MKFYADSADIAQVLPLLLDGLVRGVTTNPTILDRSDRGAADFTELYQQFTSAGAQEVFFQTWGQDAAELLKNAQRITALGDRVVVKLPATRNGYSAAHQLQRSGTPTLLTGVNTVAQAIAAAQVGAEWIAPYFGQIADRTGAPPIDLIAAMQAALQGTDTEILLASIRSPETIEATAAVGVRAFTARPDVILACTFSEHTETAAQIFEDVMSRRA